MTEARKESLSALLDGEASEIEVHRLVREFRSDDSLTTSWARYQHIRTTVQRNASPHPLDPASHQALFNRITASIEAEESHNRPQVRQSPRGIVAGSLAVAAALVVAVFIGVPDPEQQGPLVADVADSAPAAAPLAVTAVSNQPEETAAPELIELDEEKQRQLRAYLNQHDRMARMNADRQFVNYRETSGK